MDCYTVDESIRPGIGMRVSDEGRPYVPVGKQQIAVSEGIVAGVQRVVDTLQDDDERLREIVEYKGLSLMTADLRDNCTMFCRQRKAYKNPRALVLLETLAESPEHLKLTSRSFVERQEARKPWLPVRRTHGPFPSVGIEVVAKCGTNYLLMMAQGSGFRIHRTGPLDNELPRTLIVSLTKSGLTMRRG